MKSNVESGINTYLGNFNKLISACESFGIGYNPSPPNLQIFTLKGQSQIIKSAINHVDDILSTSINAEDDRQQAFSILPAIATRVQAIAVVSDVPDAVLVHVKEIVRKIRGQRAHKIKIDPLEENPQKHVSVS
ncbi:MAG: hypothetical protein LBG80_02335, partial [Bacteroidales bacterium]|nr:hypothetical protein [Bacteroidales bacterium]